MPMKSLRMLTLNETGHAMLFWDTQKFRFCSQNTTLTMHSITEEVLAQYTYQVATVCVRLNMLYELLKQSDRIDWWDHDIGGKELHSS